MGYQIVLLQILQQFFAYVQDAILLTEKYYVLTHYKCHNLLFKLVY
jgi:hypothetical protein